MPDRSVLPSTAVPGVNDVAPRDVACLRCTSHTMRFASQAATLVEVGALVNLVVRIHLITAPDGLCNTSSDVNSANVTAAASTVAATTSATTTTAMLQTTEPAPECTPAYFLAYTALMLVVLVGLVLPYVAHLAARLSLLLHEARIQTPLRHGATSVSPFYGVVYAVGGWLSVIVVVFLDIVELFRSMGSLAAYTCCVLCQKRRLRPTNSRRIARTCSACAKALHGQMPLSAANALVLQRGVAQTLFCSIPSSIACAVCLANSSVQVMWGSGYTGGWTPTSGGGAGWNFDLLFVELVIAAAASSAHLLLFWMYVLFEARALNEPVSLFLSNSLHGRAVSGTWFALEDQLMNSPENLPRLIILGDSTSGSVTSSTVQRVKLASGGYAIHGQTASGGGATTLSWPGSTIIEQGLSEDLARQLANVLYRSGRQHMRTETQVAAHLSDKTCTLFVSAQACADVSLHTILRMHAAAEQNASVRLVLAADVDWVRALEVSRRLGFLRSVEEGSKWNTLTPAGVPLLEYAARLSLPQSSTLAGSKNANRQHGGAASKHSARASKPRLHRPDSSSDEEETDVVTTLSTKTRERKVDQNADAESGLAGRTRQSLFSQSEQMFETLFHEALTAGADPNILVDGGEASVLLLCAQNGSAKHVAELLRHGAVPDSSSSRDTLATPLGAALLNLFGSNSSQDSNAADANTQIVELLVGAKADIGRPFSASSFFASSIRPGPGEASETANRQFIKAAFGGGDSTKETLLRPFEFVLQCLASDVERHSLCCLRLLDTFYPKQQLSDKIRDYDTRIAAREVLQSIHPVAGITDKERALVTDIVIKLCLKLGPMTAQGKDSGKVGWHSGNFGSSAIFVRLLDHLLLLGGNDIAWYGDPRHGRTFFHMLAAANVGASDGLSSDSAAAPRLRAVLDHWVSRFPAWVSFIDADFTRAMTNVTLKKNGTLDASRAQLYLKPLLARRDHDGYSALELAIQNGCVGGESSSITGSWVDGLCDWLWNVQGRGRVVELLGRDDLQRIHVIMRDKYYALAWRLAQYRGSRDSLQCRALRRRISAFSNKRCFGRASKQWSESSVQHLLQFSDQRDNSNSSNDNSKSAIEVAAANGDFQTFFLMREDDMDFRPAAARTDGFNQMLQAVEERMQKLKEHAVEHLQPSQAAEALALEENKTGEPSPSASTRGDTKLAKPPIRLGHFLSWQGSTFAPDTPIGRRNRHIYENEHLWIELAFLDFTMAHGLLPKDIQTYTTEREKIKREFYVQAQRQLKGGSNLAAPKAGKGKRKGGKPGSKKSQSKSKSKKGADVPRNLDLNKQYLLQRDPVLGGLLRCLQTLSMTTMQWTSLVVSVELVASGKVCCRTWLRCFCVLLTQSVVLAVPCRLRPALVESFASSSRMWFRLCG